jgi:segregation and condensation protein A
MAAMLIEIKSRMLLPVKKADTGEEVQDPRAELVRRLLEYEKMKLAALELERVPVLGRDFWRASATVDDTVVVRFPDVDPHDLRLAWLDVMKRAKLNAHHKITREELSVRDHMTQILRSLQDTRFVEFGDLFSRNLQGRESVPVLIVHFLALLELARETLVELTQAEAYAPIYVRLAYAPL